MIEEREAEIENRTREANLAEVELCQRAIDTVLDGFDALGLEMEWDDERRGNTLLLVGLAYNSLRWAFELLLKGYYTQSMALSRTAWEAWLNAAYLQLFPEISTADWQDFRKRPQPKRMRELVAQRSGENTAVDPIEFQKGMNSVYSNFSEYSHPTARSLRVLIGEKHGEHSLRLGGDYDEVLVLQATNAFCIASFAIASLFAYLLPNADAYLRQRQVVVVAWTVWGNALGERLSPDTVPED